MVGWQSAYGCPCLISNTDAFISVNFFCHSAVIFLIDIQLKENVYTYFDLNMLLISCIFHLVVLLSRRVIQCLGITRPEC
jgi:hypothetical protein